MQPPGPDIRATSDEVAGLVAQGEKVYVEGSIGAGRSSLVDRLREEHDAIVLDLLPLREIDAPAAALVEFASSLPPADRPRMTRGGDDEYNQIATVIRERLAEAQRLVVLRLPASWAQITERSDEYSGVATDDARAWFTGITAVKAPTVVVADAAIAPRQLGLHQWRVLRLPDHRLPLAALESVPWGSYARDFATLHDLVEGDRCESPLVWRLAVGALGLGSESARVRALIDKPNRLRALAGEISHLAAACRPLAESLRVALAIRRPMAPATFVALASPPPEHEPLFTQCVGYGVHAVRIAEPVWLVLAQALARVGLPQRGHHDLSAHYRSLDGASSPWSLDRDGARAWSEKVHHVAHSDPDEWTAQELVAPEQYWDRARVLSHARRYRDASALYARCVERFPLDDYGWHYGAWNLQQARGDRREVEERYRRAIRLAPENPWWNSRLVTFLIEDGQPAIARKEWTEALARVDADGEEVVRSPWLALHLHRWVADAWLRAGRAAWADEALGGIASLHNDEPRLVELAKRVHAANPSVGHEDPEWTAFLGELPARCGVAEFHAEHVRDTWKHLRRLGGAELPIPLADRTADGERVYFTWSYASVLLELEIDALGGVEWFARDRRSGASAEGHRVDEELAMWLEWVIRG